MSSRYRKTLALGAVLFASGLACAFAADAPRGAPEFTAAQVKDGARVYAASCVQCHGANLEGVSGPPLRADDVADAATPTVAELYSVVSKLMPKNKPGTLAPEQAAAVMAYLLATNGAAPGTHALTAAGAASAKQKYVHAPAAGAQLSAP